MHIKKGDTVKILAGRDRGKGGKVIVLDPKAGRATVEGRNLFFRHKRPRKQGEKGQRIELPGKIALARLMLICPHCGKPTRASYSITEQGDKVRICKNCGKTIA